MSARRTTRKVQRNPEPSPPQTIFERRRRANEHVNALFHDRLEEAFVYIGEHIGQVWSRYLDDHIYARAICTPKSLFGRADLEVWLKSVFNSFHINVIRSEWREETDYEIHIVCSECDDVHIGPHLYMEFGLRRRKPFEEVADPGPPVMPAWYVKEECTDIASYTLRVIEEGAEEEEVDGEKIEFGNVVDSD
jgi:hypothetical protein